MRYIAIDFETANEARNSACEIGIAVMENGQVTEEKAWLIRPPELYFNSINISIHGITAKDVRDQPTFGQLWPELRPYFEGNTVVAHNASFDFSVLRAALTTFRIDFPELRYACSYLLSKKIWPGLFSYRLNDMASMHNIALDHHRALSDAVACGKLTHAILEQHQVLGEDEWESKLDMKLGRLYPGGYKPASIRKKK